jgi:hypothetical protein
MSLRAAIAIALFGSVLAIPVGAASPEVSAQDSHADALSDRATFRAFIQSRPTPEEFQQAYPDVWLILPGDIVTRSFCSQYYRYVARLDAEGRISGGSLE